MIRLPSTMGEVDKIFRRFAQDASWLMRYVVRQRNSWREAAVASSQRVQALQLDNRKLREMLNTAVARCNAVDAEREHYQKALRTLLVGNPVPTEPDAHIWLMRNDSYYRAAMFRAQYPRGFRQEHDVMTALYGPTPQQEGDIYASAALDKIDWAARWARAFR